MYSATSETDVVLLGVPSHNTKDTNDPRVTKIGGNPVWHDHVNAPKTSSIICKSCHSCKNIVLVAQIYAPVDNSDRSLYIFACNTRKCSLSSLGWRVLRNQKIIDSIPEVKNVIIPKSNPTSMWGDLNEENGLNSTFDDLNDLLMARDESLKNISTNNISHKSTSATVNSDCSINSNQFCEVVWPCIIIDTINETLKSGEYDEDDLEFKNSMNVDDEKVYNLLQSYMSNEEDKDLVEVIREYATNKEDLGHCNKCSFTKNDYDGGSESLDRKFAKIDEKSRAELYFQQIVSYESNQVLRYAYEGEPLWCTKPHPIEFQNKDKGGIPVCNVCCSPRVFEFQLMPALLSYIPKDDSSVVMKEVSCVENPVISNVIDEKIEHDSDNDELTNHISVTQSHLSQDLIDAFMQALGNNLDFGVVGVWSCPNSCQEGHEEVVIVQPPSDIAI